MKVLKFGGTSVGTPERMRQIARLITDYHQVMVVLSAISGTTNRLVAIAERIEQQKPEEAFVMIDSIYTDAMHFSEELLSKNGLQKEMNAFLVAIHAELISIVIGNNKSKIENESILLSKGELISTLLFSLYLQEIGRDVLLLPALEFMYLDATGEPDTARIQKNLCTYLQNGSSETIYITQGFICRTATGEVSNLKRGGSDYSAAIIGAALEAEEIQIWTDIDGMHNNDPRIITDTQPVPELSYQEAAELAYFGAKILHPGTVHPARQAGIPIRIKNTMNPDAAGTLITDRHHETGVKAIAAKDNITVIRICSSRMLMAYGFLKSVFEVFERFKTPIDMITTSEVAVSLTIDDARELPAITKELEKFGAVEVTTDQVIICIAGFFPRNSNGYAADIISAVRAIPLRMVSYGGSEHNISLLVEKQYKAQALQSLQQELFNLVHV